MYIRYWNPETFGSIIGGYGLRTFRHTTLKEHVERGDIKTHIPIYIRNRKEITAGGNVETRLFLHLTGDAFLSCLIEIYKAAGKVEHAFCRLLATACHKHLPPFIYYKRRSGGTGIQIIYESTVPALATFLVIFLEMRASALRAELEYLVEIHSTQHL